MPAVALTDQSNLFAMVKFYRAAQSSGVKPIIGVDMRCTKVASAPFPRASCCCVRTNRLSQPDSARHRSYLEGQRKGLATIERDWLTRDTLPA